MNGEDCVRRKLSKSQHHLPNSNSEGNIEKYLASSSTLIPRRRLPNSDSEGYLDSSPKSGYGTLERNRSLPMIQQRRHSYSDGVRLPQIVNTNSLDETKKPPRKKKHRKHGSNRGSRAGAGGTESGGESRRSSKSSVSSVVSQSEELLSDITGDTTEFSEALQPLFESPEMLSAIQLPTGGYTCPPPLNADQNPELFYSTMSARAPEEESVISLSATPTQETIEGAGLYDPNVNRLPDSDVEEAEDRELKGFSKILTEACVMMVRDTTERVQAQHSKVINKYREQCIVLQTEHQEEKLYLERQIEQEKSRNQVMQRLMGVKLEENRADLKLQTETLQSLHQQFQTKKEQVAELRQRLNKSEDELRAVRTNLAKQKMKTSELMPILPGQTQRNLLSEIETTQSYLDSILRLMPDEKLIKEELAKRHRLLQGRPVTTGMLHKEPCASRLLFKEGKSKPPSTSCSTASLGP